MAASAEGSGESRTALLQNDDHTGAVATAVRRDDDDLAA